MALIWKWALNDFCLMILEMFIDKFDCFIVIEGNRSLGKSTLAWEICRKVNHYARILARDFPEWSKYYKFKPQLQAKNPKKYKYLLYKRDDVINFFNKWNVIGIGDEAVNVAFNREFYSDDQKNLIKLINMNRDHRNLFIMCVPQFNVLDNQIKNLCKIRISIVRRGLAIIQTPNPLMYGRDKWDTANNEKIEREWLMTQSKRPKYTKLTTFRGIMHFPKLSDAEEKIYQQIKNAERNVIRKDLGINDVVEKEPVDIITERLMNGGIKNMQFIEGFAISNGLTSQQLQGRIKRKLSIMGKNQAISSYFTDKKAKNVEEPDEEFTNLVKDINLEYGK